MKKIFTLLFLIVFFTTCKKDWSTPLADCTLDFLDSSQNNPKKNLYQSLLDKYVRQGVPGIAMLVRTPKEGLWVGAAGKAKIETGEPMLPCHIHHSGSVAKMYIGVATMLLAEEGKIDLDAPINKYLDKNMCDHIENGNKATVRQLLNHTSGIRDFITEVKHLTDYFNNLFNNYSTEYFIKYIYDKKADFEPGTSVHYSNINFVLLTLIIDRVTGKSHADFINERILKKQGLVHTYYKNGGGYPQPPGLVNSYFDRYGDGSFENITTPANHFDEISVGHDALQASVSDYAKFVEALFKGKIVNTNSLTQMKQWKYAGRQEDIYTGLGLLRKETKYGDVMGHDGGNLGVVMICRYYPKDDITIVFCANICGFFESPVLERIKNLDSEIADLAFK